MHLRAYETKNLADDPKFASIKSRLREQLDAWMAQQADIGVETELMAKSRQGRGRQKKTQSKKDTRRKPRKQKKADAQ